MNGITELALMFKERENSAGYSPMIGRIISLPDLKIAVGDKILLEQSALKICVELTHNEEYSDIGKEVVLLPYKELEEFILIGVIR